MSNPSFLVLDIETDSPNPEEANLKWFGAYSYKDEKYHLLNYTHKEEIKNLIEDHKYIIGFNNLHFDNPIIERFLNEDVFQYKIILDLWQCLAPKQRGVGEYNKNRFNQMFNKQLKNYKLKTIVEELKLDESNKGDIDYNIFKKDKWDKNEIKEIKKYLKQDLVITVKLLEWYHEQFEPLTKLMDKEDVRKLKHLRASIPSLAYSIICHNSGLPFEFSDKKPENVKSYSGGHHINPRWDLVKGNIIEIDFSSAYPHAMMMCNLYSPTKEGWSGDGYYNIEGTYNNKKQGIVEKTINNIFVERLKAKQNKDTAKNLSYKMIINSVCGLTGNYKFKSLYNLTTASDCTSIVRTWMKKLAKTIEENGFSCLYGYTDSIFVKIPGESNKNELMYVINKTIEEFKQHTPFPLETFKMDIEFEIKLIWFISKNRYLFITKDNDVIHKSTLLDKNTPKAVMKLFKNYIKPKMIKELDVNFSLKELHKELKDIIKNDLELAGEVFKVNKTSNYNVKTSLQYQISEKYNEGTHFLIPNTRNIGVGKSVKRCSFEEFKQNNLTIDDVDLKNLIKHIKPFYSIKKEGNTPSLNLIHKVKP